jgi:insulysin
MTSTVYYFDVAADALEGALDRFAGFFSEPLFNEVRGRINLEQKGRR